MEKVFPSGKVRGTNILNEEIKIFASERENENFIGKIFDSFKFSAVLHLDWYLKRVITTDYLQLKSILGSLLKRLNDVIDKKVRKSVLY